MIHLEVGLLLRHQVFLQRELEQLAIKIKIKLVKLKYLLLY